MVANITMVVLKFGFFFNFTVYNIERRTHFIYGFIRYEVLQIHHLIHPEGLRHVEEED